MLFTNKVHSHLISTAWSFAVGNLDQSAPLTVINMGTHLLPNVDGPQLLMQVSCQDSAHGGRKPRDRQFEVGWMFLQFHQM